MKQQDQDQFATKKDLLELEERLTKKFEEREDRLEKRLAENMNETISAVATQILNVMADHFAQINLRFDRIEARLDRHDGLFDDHEIRLRRIEAHHLGTLPY